MVSRFTFLSLGARGETLTQAFMNCFCKDKVVEEYITVSNNIIVYFIVSKNKERNHSQTKTRTPLHDILLSLSHSQISAPLTGDIVSMILSTDDRGVRMKLFLLSYFSQTFYLIR